MRNEDRWNHSIKLRIIPKKFPPRIAMDLLTLDLEDVYEEESLFIFSEEKGTGKTIYASRVLMGHERKAYLELDNISSVFITQVELMNELKASFDTKEQSEIDILRKYQNVDVLVLDDLGTSKMSDWMYHIMFSLIDHRYNYMKTTIITSNHSLEELIEAWKDDRIVSRIDRMGSVVIKEKYD